MLTHAQQIASAALTLAFGLLALAVARRLGARRGSRPAAAWAHSGSAFVLTGGLALVHALSGFGAWLAGPESAFYRQVAAWMAPGNFSRAVLTAVYAAALLALLLVRRGWVGAVAGQAPAAFVVATVAALGAARAAGLAGFEGVSIPAMVSAVAAVVLMAALLVAVVNDGLDQLLWFALAAYALKDAVTVSLMATIIWWELGDAGPVLAALRTFYWISSGVLAVMCGIAWRRLAQAAAGRHVPALFERMHALRAPAPRWLPRR